MEPLMEEITIRPFVKYIVLKVDLLLETEVIDEYNFGVDDEFAIMQFKRKYIDRDDCVIVGIEM